MSTKLDILERSIASSRALSDVRKNKFPRSLVASAPTQAYELSPASRSWASPKIPALGGALAIILAQLYMLALWLHAI